MFHVPERYRYTNHPLYGHHPNDKHNGVFGVPLDAQGAAYALCIASDGSDSEHTMDVWEHVSVSVQTSGGVRIATWDEMCKVKATFWDAEDVVVQFHPARSQYVNQHPNVLHLWRSRTYRQPMPPRLFV